MRLETPFSTATRPWTDSVDEETVEQLEALGHRE
jgi:hypothetical protein